MIKWDKKDIAPELVKNIAAKYGCDLLSASILARRGVVRGEDIQFFLEDDPRYIRNPFGLPGMEDAVDRIIAAKEEGEKILVFGDGDVDGITGTVLLTSYLKSLGLDISWRIPNGDEAYGLSMQAVEEFAAAYGTLIITVDCGISCINEIRRARQLSVDVIVTDHHEPREELPEALAIVNPKLKDSAYPFRDLSGCGVAFKLVMALRFALESDLYGQPLCLLNTQPVNDAWVIEIAKLRNLTVIDTLFETVVPGVVSITDTRLPAFLEGQQILVWDGALQKKTLAKLFGGGVEVGMLDIAPEIGKEIPQTAGKSLLRIKELSRIAKYSEKELTELDVFVNLFCSFMQKREKLFIPEGPELQLAALGTIQDIMPLKDENRIIIKSGIASLRTKPRAGLSELLFCLGLAGRRFDAKDISWKLCPVINAARRMGNAEKAALLFFEDDPQKRNRMAEELIGMNNERKKLEEKTWAIVEPRAYDNLPLYHEKFALVYGEDIDRGVAGLIAQRLSKRFKVPAMVVSFGETVLTGSLRSAGGYNVSSLLEQHAGLFIDSGGHQYAAGFSMEKTNWEIFSERLKTAALSIELTDEEETIPVDAELPPDYLNPDIFNVVDRFEPYGKENPPLVFLAKKIKIQEISLLGKTEIRHVKLLLDTGKYKWPALYWQAADKLDLEFSLGDTVDLVFELSRNYYQGTETPQIIVTDLRRSGAQGI
ncbi:MAG: single-stranded-DNA-specific exonuclease RecJ [Treponema sp.]|jgi:single-stranded-DNA-specific exonuclease|nr:single-stranded-DNA-specific exonuclease RecJ [Treponema sp.]